jgi:hypothetical protein
MMPLMMMHRENRPAQAAKQTCVSLGTAQAAGGFDY